MSQYRDRLVELLPHYLVIVVLIVVALTVADLVVGELERLTRLFLAVVVALAYPIALRMTGHAPEAWS